MATSKSKAAAVPAPKSAPKSAPKPLSSKSLKNADTDVSLKDGETSVGEEEVTIPHTDDAVAVEDLFDGYIEPPESELERSEAGFVTDVEEPNSGEGLPEADRAPAGSGTSHDDDEQHHDGGSPEHIPGSRSQAYSPSLGRVRLAPVRPGLLELQRGTTLKSEPVPPSRPQSTIQPLRRALCVPAVNGRSHPPTVECSLMCCFTGSWRGLRCLGLRNAAGQYSVVPPSAPAAMPSMEAGNPSASPPPVQNFTSGSDDRPKMPPHIQFTFARSIHELARDMKDKYLAVAVMTTTLQQSSEQLLQHSAQLSRRNAVLTQKVEMSKSWDDRIIPLLAQSAGVVKDVKAVIDIVAKLHSMVAGIAQTFHIVPPAPVNWIALLEILETGRHLKDLHKFMWAKLDQFEEDFRPLRGEAATLRIDCDDVRHRLDSILSEVDDLMVPLFRNMGHKFSAAIIRVENRIGLLDGSVVDGGTPDAPGPRRANLGDLVSGMSSIVDDLRRLDGRVSELDTAPLSLGEVTGGAGPRLPNLADLAHALRDLTARVNTLDGTSIDVSAAITSPEPRSANIGDILVMLTQLTSRVTALEGHVGPTPAPEDIDVHITAYLSRLGLSEEMLRHLATHLFYTSTAPTGGSISSGPSRTPYTGPSGITGAFQASWSGSLGAVDAARTEAGTFQRNAHSAMSTGSPLTSYPSSISNEGGARVPVLHGDDSEEDGDHDDRLRQQESQSSEDEESEG